MAKLEFQLVSFPIVHVNMNVLSVVQLLDNKFMNTIE